MAETDRLLPPRHAYRSTKPGLAINSTTDDGLDVDFVAHSTTGSAKEHTDPADLVVYKRRWYVLVVFSLLCFSQAAAWNTWGPIADTAKAVLNWNDGNIALLANWGTIAFLSTGLLFSYLLLSKGFRYCVLLSALIYLLGIGLRCIPVGIDNVKWTMNIGHICIGLAGPILMSCPTELSSIWFPPHQRTTSTAISASAGFLGVSASFIIGPYIVTGLPQNSSADDISPIERTSHFNEIMTLMYIECGFSAVVVVAALLYFPEKPPTSPSITADKPRQSFFVGAKAMLKSAPFWITALAYSISTGVFGGWNTQLDTLFANTLNVGQYVVGWIGFFTNIGAVIGGLICGRLVDFLGGKMKAVLLVLILASFISCAWCVCLTMGYISYNLVSLYASCIGIGVFVNAAVPLYFEITVEGMYPVSEGNVTMVMTMLNNLAALIFLLLPMIPDIGVIWMNWVLLSSIAVCFPLLLMYKERYNRLNTDLHVE